MWSQHTFALLLKLRGYRYARREGLQHYTASTLSVSTLILSISWTFDFKNVSAECNLLLVNYGQPWVLDIIIFIIITIIITI